MIKINNTDISGVYVGSTSASAIYLGSQQVWSAGGGRDYSQEYFTLSALESGTFSWNVDNVEYSLNDGTWTTWSAVGSGNTMSVSTGDKVRLKSSTNTNYQNKKIRATGRFDIEGNTMSLFYGDNFENQTSFPSSGTSIFQSLFQENTYLINAENLVLPATAFTKLCYYQMFRDCTSLANAPELPATTLIESCYQQMFQGCSSLTSAPELPATGLERKCYYQMFMGCTNLNYVKCLATALATNSTYAWLWNTSASGTFIKNANMSSWTTGESGIPSGWTVVDA